MLDHCTYDKIKLLHEISSIIWFIEKHGKEDAQHAKEHACHELLERLKQDLEKYIDELYKLV